MGVPLRKGGEGSFLIMVVASEVGVLDLERDFSFSVTGLGFGGEVVVGSWAAVAVLVLAVGFFERGFLVAGFLVVGFLVAFFAGAGFEAGFLATGFGAADFLEADFAAAGFLVVGAFLAAGFLVVDFLVVGFLGPCFLGTCFLAITFGVVLVVGFFSVFFAAGLFTVALSDGKTPVVVPLDFLVWERVTAIVSSFSSSFFIRLELDGYFLKVEKGDQGEIKEEKRWNYKEILFSLGRIIVVGSVGFFEESKAAFVNQIPFRSQYFRTTLAPDVLKPYHLRKQRIHQ